MKIKKGAKMTLVQGAENAQRHNQNLNTKRLNQADFFGVDGGI